MKAEDVDKLLTWQKEFGVPIVIAHLFDQEGFVVGLGELERFRTAYLKDEKSRVHLQITTGIFAKDQRYERVDALGAGEVKPVFIITPAIATRIGKITGVKVNAQLGVSASMKYVSHVIFSGGQIELSPEFIQFLRGVRKR
ncbi:MAG: hypothetical protein ACREFR_17415 [Limisphaerales bacterium]